MAKGDNKVFSIIWKEFEQTEQNFATV